MIDFAKTLVEEESQNIAIDKEDKEIIDAPEKINNLFDNIRGNVLYSNKINSYIDKSQLENSNICELLEENFDNKIVFLEKLEESSRKLEEKASLLTNGYIKRYNTISKSINELNEKYSELKNLNIVYKNFLEQDKISIEKRKNDYQEKSLKNKEKGRLFSKLL